MVPVVMPAIFVRVVRGGIIVVMAMEAPQSAMAVPFPVVLPEAGGFSLFHAFIVPVRPTLPTVATFISLIAPDDDFVVAGSAILRTGTVLTL